MMLREGCRLCFDEDRPTPHDGDHLVRQVYGGRASCPIDEADDTDIYEELIWVSLEQAIENAGWPLRNCDTLARNLLGVLEMLINVTSIDGRPIGAIGIDHAGYSYVWSARTDEHLEEVSGTLDLVCTITGPVESVPA